MSDSRGYEKKRGVDLSDRRKPDEGYSSIPRFLHIETNSRATRFRGRLQKLGTVSGKLCL
jgi:hypothetical protein